MTRIIAVTNNKGGVAKSSTVIHLAPLFAKEGKKVLIIDTDEQGNSTLSFGYNPDDCQYTIFDLMVNHEDAKKAIIQIDSNLDLLPSNTDISLLEFEILIHHKKYNDIFSLLYDAIKPIEHEYDYIFIDTPSHLGLMHGNVLTYAKEVILPFIPETYSMRSLVKTFDAIENFKNRKNKDLKILGVLATKYEKTKIHKKVAQKTRSYCNNLDIPMFQTVIPKAIGYTDYIATHGKPLTMSRKSNKLVSVYYSLKGEIESE